MAATNNTNNTTSGSPRTPTTTSRPGSPMQGVSPTGGAAQTAGGPVYNMADLPLPPRKPPAAPTERIGKFTIAVTSTSDTEHCSGDTPDPAFTARQITRWVSHGGSMSNLGPSPIEEKQEELAKLQRERCQASSTSAVAKQAADIDRQAAILKELKESREREAVRAEQNEELQRQLTEVRETARQAEADKEQYKAELAKLKQSDLLLSEEDAAMLQTQTSLLLADREKIDKRAKALRKVESVFVDWCNQKGHVIPQEVKDAMAKVQY